MKKTIFYKKSETDKGDYWFEQTPYNVWFELDDTLYEPNGNIRKRVIMPNGCIGTIIPMITQDTFSDEGIIRRIAMNI